MCKAKSHIKTGTRADTQTRGRRVKGPAKWSSEINFKKCNDKKSYNNNYRVLFRKMFAIRIVDEREFYRFGQPIVPAE